MGWNDCACASHTATTSAITDTATFGRGAFLFFARIGHSEISWLNYVLMKPPPTLRELAGLLVVCHAQAAREF
jgi:hypothetical protein